MKLRPPFLIVLIAAIVASFATGTLLTVVFWSLLLIWVGGFLTLGAYLLIRLWSGLRSGLTLTPFGSVKCRQNPILFGCFMTWFLVSAVWCFGMATGMAMAAALPGFDP